MGFLCAYTFYDDKKYLSNVSFEGRGLTPYNEANNNSSKFCVNIYMFVCHRFVKIIYVSD